MIRILAALSAIFLLLTALPAHAATDFAWSVQPTRVKGAAGRDYFVYTAAPGQRITDSVSITNRSDRTLGFRVYATDAFNTQDGSFALLTADQRPSDVGSWVTFKRGTYQIKAGKSVAVPFTLTVPADAPPGDHGGGVLAAVSEQVTDAKGQRLNVDRRIAARVYLRVNGTTTPALRIDSLTATRTGGGLTITYQVRNTGNVRLTAAARIAATGPFGIPLGHALSRAVPELLPGNAYRFTEHLTGVPAAGRLTATVRLTPADPASGQPPAAAPVVGSASLWAVPWPALAVAAVLLAGLGYLVRRRRSVPTRRLR